MLKNDLQNTTGNLTKYAGRVIPVKWNLLREMPIYRDSEHGMRDEIVRQQVRKGRKLRSMAV